MRRLRGGPLNSANTSNANEPNAAMIDVCGCWITLSANAKTSGMTIAARAALFSAARFGTGADHTPAWVRPLLVVEHIAAQKLVAERAAAVELTCEPAKLRQLGIARLRRSDEELYPAWSDT